MAFARGQALLAMDMQREREAEQKAYEQEQKKMAKRGGRSMWGSLGLGLIGGALLGPAGMFIGQQVGRYGGRAMTGRGLKTDFKNMYGVSDKLRNTLKKGKFNGAYDKKYLYALDRSDSFSSDLLSTAADAISMGIAAGGKDAILGKATAEGTKNVGGLKELTTYGASGAGGKAGLLGGYVAGGGAEGGFGFMTPKEQWTAGQFGTTPGTPTMDAPGSYSRTKGVTGLKQTPVHLNKAETATFFKPGIATEALENPEFSKWRYLMDMGSPTAMPGVDPAASPDAPWLQNLYNAGTGQAQGLMGQLTGSQQLSRVLSSLDDTSDDYYNI